jgi:MFS family permease
MANFMLTFFSYLLKSSCYDVPVNEVATVTGLMAFYTQIVVLFFDFGLGTIMDTFGRKIPCILGLLLGGAALIAMPYAYALYPNLLILR